MQYLKQIFLVGILFLIGNKCLAQNFNFVDKSKAEIGGILDFSEIKPQYSFYNNDTMICSYDDVRTNIYIFNDNICIKTIYVYIGALSGANNEVKTITWTNDEDNNEYLYSLTIKDYFTFITIIKNEYNNKTVKEE